MKIIDHSNKKNGSCIKGINKYVQFKALSLISRPVKKMAWFRYDMNKLCLDSYFWVTKEYWTEPTWHKNKSCRFKSTKKYL